MIGWRNLLNGVFVRPIDFFPSKLYNGFRGGCVVFLFFGFFHQPINQPPFVGDFTGLRGALWSRISTCWAVRIIWEVHD